MALIKKILEFNIDTTESVAITKRNWGKIRGLIESQMSSISAAVWDGMSKHDIAKAIAKIIYALVLTTHDAELEELVTEYLQSEHRQ
ncbi:MAG TPA: hypothetical protein VIN07_13585 [Flavipsychrobacter sp.]